MCILRTYTNEIIHRLPRRYAGIKKFNLTVSLNEGVGVCAHGRRHRGEGREGCMGYIVLRTFVACTPQGGGGGYNEIHIQHLEILLQVQCATTMTLKIRRTAC